MHTNAIEIPRFKDIWSDKTRLHFASTMDSSTWISSERLQAMEEETRRDETTRRPGRILQFPEPVYCPERYWFKIDEYSVPKLIDAGKDGKVFFCFTQSSHPPALFLGNVLVVPSKVHITLPSTRCRTTGNFGNMRGMRWHVLLITSTRTIYLIFDLPTI